MRSWLKNWHLRVEAFIWGTGTCGLTFEGQRQWSKTWIMVQYIAQHVDKKLAAITADQWKISSGTILGSGMPQKRILFLRFLPQKMSCNRLCKIPGSERQKHCKNMPGYRNFYFSANVWVNQTIVGVCVSGHLATILPSNSNDQWWQTGTNCLWSHHANVGGIHLAALLYVELTGVILLIFSDIELPMSMSVLPWLPWFGHVWARILPCHAFKMLLCGAIEQHAQKLADLEFSTIKFDVAANKCCR